MAATKAQSSLTRDQNTSVSLNNRIHPLIFLLFIRLERECSASYSTSSVSNSILTSRKREQTNQYRLRIIIDILMTVTLRLVDLMEDDQMRMLLDRLIPPVPRFAVNGTFGKGVKTLGVAPVTDRHELVGGFFLTAEIGADAEEAVLFATLGVIKGFDHGHEMVACLFEAGGEHS